MNTSKNTSPKIYLKAAEYMGSDPEDTWVFEDVLHAIETTKEQVFIRWQCMTVQVKRIS